MSSRCKSWAPTQVIRVFPLNSNSERFNLLETELVCSEFDASVKIKVQIKSLHIFTVNIYCRSDSHLTRHEVDIHFRTFVFHVLWMRRSTPHSRPGLLFFWQQYFIGPYWQLHARVHQSQGFSLQYPTCCRSTHNLDRSCLQMAMTVYDGR